MGTANQIQNDLVVSTALDMRGQWGWLLALGICLLILGVIALVDSLTATVVSMLFSGWILLLAGIVEGLQAIRHRGTGRVFLHVLNAALSIVVGVMLLRHPLEGALVFTLLLAVYFIVAAVFRIVTAFNLRRLPGWGWILFDGVATLILGLLIWLQWPISGLWVIGLFIGIDLIVVGASQVMLALALRTIPKPA